MVNAAQCPIAAVQHMPALAVGIVDDHIQQRHPGQRWVVGVGKQIGLAIVVLGRGNGEPAVG